MSFLKHSGVQHPIICGAMYPCSNPELIAAASDAGGLGIIQPLSLTYVHGHDLREGIQKIRGLTQKPVGFNLIVEQSVKIYQKRMEMGLDVALSEGIRFFITALGNPGRSRLSRCHRTKVCVESKRPRSQWPHLCE